MRTFLTGATGFVGSHVAEACARKGWPVTALVRPGSDTAFLKTLPGVALLEGSLDDLPLLRRAFTETDVVVHAAAKVGNWGPMEDYRPVNVEGLRHLLEAAKGQALSRFVHISSLGVYAGKHHHGTDETTPPAARHHDSYSQSKVEAEKVALDYYRDFGVPVVVLRPGFVYGPRDKAVMPRLIENLRNRAVRYPGAKGRRALNTIFVRNLVDAVFLAIDREEAVGQVYNLTDGEFVSKKRFIEGVADHMGLPHPHLMPPYWLAYAVMWTAEKMARLRGAKQAPRFNWTTFKFLALNLDFSIEKARRELGYHPRVSFDDALAETMAWYKSEQPPAPAGDA